MSEDLKNNIRLSKAAKEFNIGMSTIIEFLGKKGHKCMPFSLKNIKAKKK